MYLFNDLFKLEENYLLSAIIGGVTAILSIIMFVLARKSKREKVDKILIISLAVTFVCTVVSTLFCYNILVVIGYLVSIVSLTGILTYICIAYHKSTIYSISYRNLYLKMFMPVFVIGLMFRPWFVENEGAWYSLMPSLGLNSTGTYAYDINVITGNAQNPTTWNIISIVELFLFVGLITMQIIMIWRLFADPDNAKAFANFEMFITVLGAFFIYGVYTSPNFNISTTMELATIREFDMDTKQLIEHQVYRVVGSNVKNVTAIPFLIAALGAINRLVYIEKFEKFFDNLKDLPKNMKEMRASKKSQKAEA